MGLLESLALGFQVALSADNLLYCLLGVTLGTAIGVLPGLGPLVTISLLLPLTFGLTPEASVIMLAGIYYGAAYGGSTAAILVNVPGEAASAVTCIDGYQMARQGRAGPALAVAAIGSFVAGTIGVFIVVLGGPSIAKLALQFGAPEYTALIATALIMTASLSAGGALKSIAMALLGVLFGLVGTDVTSGSLRYTFDVPQLFDGFHLVVVAVGLFALSEIVLSANMLDREIFTSKVGRLMPSREDFRRSWRPVLRGAGVGSFFGVLPGAGQTISAFAAYLLERNISRTPERFGQGAVEGVAAPEAANNAAAQTAFIPTLALGIPGSATMALILGALLIQGINPGPRVISEHPQLFWGLIVSMWIGNLFLVILNLPLIGLWIKLISIPYHLLYVVILSFAMVGVYSVGYSEFDILLLAFFGLLGYVFVKLGCNLAVFILGFVLGPLFEENFRRSMLLSRGDAMIFLESPISAGFIGVSLIMLVLLLIPNIRRSKEEALRDAEE